MEKIDKIGGIILKNRKILVVQKKTKDNRIEYIIPGGRREKSETDIQTLKRELKEELQVDLVSSKKFGIFNDIAVFENIPIQISVYFAEIKGTLKCDSEIKKMVWIDKNYKEKNIVLGSILADYVIPRLIEMDKM